MKTEKRYTLRELSAMLDLSPRTIRFYIQEGLVDRPEGQNKGAYYTERHLRQLRTVRKYKEAGVSLERIAQILHEEESPEVDYRIRPGTIEVISRIHLAEGLELCVDPERSGLDRQAIRTLSKEILRVLEELKKEKQ